MIFNRDNKGAEELRSLTGNYYANNEFSKIKSDIQAATYKLCKVVSDAVYERALKAYKDKETSSSEEGCIQNVDKFVELVQRPIAIMATLQLYRKNDVSHEDSGRKVVVSSDGSDKIPWEWQLDRDDAIHMEEYYFAIFKVYTSTKLIGIGGTIIKIKILNILKWRFWCVRPRRCVFWKKS